MKGVDKVILNPAYLLRQDKDRVLITSELEDIWNVPQWFSFVHPIYGVILSFFDGRHSLYESIEQVALCLNVQPLLIENFVRQVYNNPKPVALCNKLGQSSHFPALLLLDDKPEFVRRRQNFANEFTLVEKQVIMKICWHIQSLQIYNLPWHVM